MPRDTPESPHILVHSDQLGWSPGRAVGWLVLIGNYGNNEQTANEGRRREPAWRCENAVNA
jgi:hypothetical protein